MISSGPHNPFHSSIFRRTHSPTRPERSSSALSFAKLPPIHNLLSPQRGTDVLQRARGSTLPSYPPPESRRSNEANNGPRTKQLSSIASESYTDVDDDNATGPRRLPPGGGVSLPPIRAENEASPTQRIFSGLPPIKTMLPSPTSHRHHVRSLDPRSPASPQSGQSIALLSSSWSSNNVHTSSGSSGDITGRFHHQFSPSIEANYQHSKERSRSPPPPHEDDRSLPFRRQNVPKPSRSSLLSLTAPRPARAVPSESHPPVSYASQRASARGEDVIMATPSSSPFPNSVPGTSRPSARRDSQEDRYAQSVEYTTQHMYTSPGQDGGAGIAGSFESSENEARLKPGETAGGKKRRSRATQEQLDLLNAVYQRTPFPTTVERNELAHRLGMTPRSVQIWFQNKRQGAKHNESRRRELPPLASNPTRSGSPQMPNMVPLTLTATSPPSPTRGLDARSMSYGAETRRDVLVDPTTGGDLRGRARRRRMSVNDLLRQDARDELRPGAVVGSSRYIGRQRPEEKDS